MLRREVVEILNADIVIRRYHLEAIFPDIFLKSCVVKLQTKNTPFSIRNPKTFAQEEIWGTAASCHPNHSRNGVDL